MKSSNLVPFETFVEYFPVLELPIVLTDSSAKEFSKHNELFNTVALEEFIGQWDDQIDEFTEFLPCFQIPETSEFTALVYYKATLQVFGFYLASFTLKGDLISIKPLNNIQFTDGLIENSVAIIDEDWQIKIVAGQQEIQALDYDPANSKVKTLEILPTGDIVHTLTNKS